MQNSSVSLLTAMLTGIIVFMLGLAWARVRGARKALTTIKQGVPAARKLFWVSIGGVLKVGFWAALLLFVLVAWQMRDIRAADERQPSPSPSVRHADRSAR
jgi:hypothetical protein